MNGTPLRTVEHFGSLIRLKRNEKKLSQAALAQMLGVDRKCVIRLEAGKPNVELRVLLRMLDVLDIHLRFAEGSVTRTGTSRLDEVFLRLERRR